jgi:inosine-uridine nucleoside N-ribohydrolase
MTERTERKMVWLDTDIGTDIDDALTLSYLLSHSDVDLLGISTVTISTLERAKLAAAICRDMGQPNLRVFTGTDHPLVVAHRQTEYPQTAAVDAAMAVEVEEQIAKTGAAVEAMYRAALRWPKQVHLLAIGPLTNLALLVRTHPDVADLLASVTLMAGRFYGPALGEWNIWCDPHAAAIVFESFKDIRSVGLDVTLQTTRPSEEIWKVFQPAGPTVSRSIEIFMASSFSFATCLSRASGTEWTVLPSVAWFFTMYSAASAWLAKLMSITDAGCPSAAARLIRRPSPRR